MPSLVLAFACLLLAYPQEAPTGTTKGPLQ